MFRVLKFFLSLVLLLITTNVFSSGGLFSKAYGDEKNEAIIFLHGGPGYNSFTFEASTAQKLADKGYYVIVFDQRGCGRSQSMSENKFTFEEAFDDIKSLYSKYHIEKASLIGHSWGGTLGAYFAAENSELVNHLILTDSPLSYQESFKVIHNKCREIYTKQENSQQLKYLDMIESMDHKSLQYSGYTFMHAMSAGLYSPKVQTEDAAKIYKEMSKNEDAELMKVMTQPPVMGLHANEAYTTINISDKLKAAIDSGIKVYGIYGNEDGLFDETQFDKFREIMGKDHFFVVEGAGHSVFIDQQKEFIDLVEKVLK
ncbi:MAG: alpha/beta hydrolase [Candidatus Kapaibacteriales bacterium]